MLIKKYFYIRIYFTIMSSDNVYIINDDGQIVLVENKQKNVSNVSNNLSQANSDVVQNNTLVQQQTRVNRARNSNGVKYTQNTQNTQNTVAVQHAPVQQPIYQRPQNQRQKLPPIPPQTPVQHVVYQRPQLPIQPVQVLNRNLNNQRQDDSVSFNNWKKMNLSMNQMVNDQNPYHPQLQPEPQSPQTEQLSNDEELDEEVPEQDFVPNSNRAKYGTFISNNTSHNTRNHGSISNKNITSYLAIRKANNNESIYL